MVKWLLKIVQLFRRFYWWLTRPETRGVRAILIDESGKVLLVRHRYQKGWFLPGGKVSRGESDENALRRELHEELGVEVTSSLQKLGVYQNTHEYKKDTIVVFIVSTFTQVRKKHFEIEEQQPFNPEVLPVGVSPGTCRRIKEWLEKKEVSDRW